MKFPVSGNEVGSLARGYFVEFVDVTAYRNQQLDIAYQRYVLEHCGIRVTGTCLMCIDSSYVLKGKLDVHQLFRITTEPRLP